MTTIPFDRAKNIGRTTYVFYNLSVSFDTKNYLVSVTNPVNPKKQYTDKYAHRASQSITMLKSFKKISKNLKKRFKPLCNNFNDPDYSIFDSDLFHLHGGINYDESGQISKFIPALLEEQDSRAEQWDIFADFIKSNQYKLL